jgi:hypothetical protein
VFEALIGEWHGEAEVPMEPPMKISVEAKLERLGEISADGKTIESRWERGMGDAGDEWETDFPINYFRK